MKNRILSLAFTLVLLAPATSFAACTDLKNNLNLGTSDKKTKGEVTKLQKFLGSRINGVFDLNTAVAVSNFKKNNRLGNSVMVDKKTRESIKNKSCSVVISNTPITINDNSQNSTNNTTITGFQISGQNTGISVNEIPVTNATGTTPTIPGTTVILPPTINFDFTE